MNNPVGLEAIPFTFLIYFGKVHNLPLITVYIDLYILETIQNNNNVSNDDHTLGNSAYRPQIFIDR